MAVSGSGARRVQRRRDKLRAAGLRPVQIWVPDIRAAGFAAECARQAGLVRDVGQPPATDDDAWSAISDTTGWTE